MKLVDLLNIANVGYPDQGLSAAYNPEDGAEPEGAEEAVGDTLALFIVRELTETFEPSAARDVQLSEGIVVMETAITELDAVRHALIAAMKQT